ncbi:hypothetical protein SAMN05216276_1005117 [Streptosporangium subroseum]|uniref:Uncharacterized protein n=1 Tax=Streptosporangium subroseum TaxID=106412 RepID=A0A239CBR0_9ACTN|nr:hypothetical protein [Streptosporangium subroseum]SNS17667.1 hypothetical protein SAMN05216276_1005117 [Streptosporangium subroseum]
MTITESELREILTGEGREDRHRGVTVADVDRRVRVIKRRRLRVVGAVAGLGIVAGLAFTVPQVRNTVVPEDIWTGVMAQPTQTPRVVSTAVGGPILLDMLANRRYKEGGARKEFTVSTGSSQFSVSLWCSGTLMKAALWIDGKLVNAGPCGGKNGLTYMINWDRPQDDRASEHIVAGAVLRTDAQTPEQVSGTADVEQLLAASKRFDLEWGVNVERMGAPGCRDNVIQVDPDTGEIVRLRCDKESTMPPTIP